MGSRRPTTLQEHVGAILPRSQRDPVSTLISLCSLVRYVVDSADTERISESKEELFELLEKPVLAGIPLLVLGNKNDLPDALTVDKVIDDMFVSWLFGL